MVDAVVDAGEGFLEFLDVREGACILYLLLEFVAFAGEVLDGGFVGGDTIHDGGVVFFNGDALCGFGDSEFAIAEHFSGRFRSWWAGVLLFIVGAFLS